MNKDLEKFINIANEYLADLKTEKAVLERKIDSDEDKTSKELKALAKKLKLVNSDIANIKDFNDVVNSLITLGELKNNIGDNVEIKKMDSLVNKLVSLTKVDNEKYAKVIDQHKYDLKGFVATLEQEKRNLKAKIDYHNTIKLDTTELASRLEEVENTLKAIKYSNVNEDICSLVSPSTNQLDKNEIYDKYSKVLAEDLNNDRANLQTIMQTSEFRDWLKKNHSEINYEIWFKNIFKVAPVKKENIVEIEQERENNIKDESDKTFGDNVKEQLHKMGEALDNHKKTIAKVAAGAIAIAVVVVAAKSCTNNKKNNTDNNSDTITTGDTTEDEIIVEEEISEEQAYKIAQTAALVSLGYDENKASEMVDNFSEETIETILNSAYNQTIENYSTISKFNLDYINDYENARTIYNITSSNAVDYVNRAYLIQETGFYSDLQYEINDIVEIVMAINEGTLNTVNDKSLAQSFNTVINRITDDYLFNTITDEDVEKVEALNYFAKDDTDLDKFLTNYATLLQSVLKNPDSLDAKEELYSYLKIYATSLNGFNNDKTALTQDNEFNSNATINSYLDWYITYESFIAPFYPVFTTYDGDTKNIEDKVYSIDMSDQIADEYYDRVNYIITNYSSVKSLQELFDEEEIAYLKFQELQEIMLTALKDPQMTALCQTETITIPDAVENVYTNTTLDSMVYVNNGYSRKLGGR